MIRGFALLLALLVLAWATEPWWAPALIASRLPPGWSLDAARVGRPGPEGVDIDLLEVSGRLGNVRLAVTVTNMRASYAGPKARAEHIQVTLTETPGTAPAPFEPAEFALPRLLVPGNVPDIEIGQLVLALPLVGLNQPVILSDLELRQEADDPLTIAADIERIPALDQPGHLALNLSPRDITAELEIGTDTRLSGRQYVDGESVATDLHLDANLATIEPGRLSALLAGHDLPGADTLSGQVTFAVHFSGADAQRPRTADLQLAGVEVTGQTFATTASLTAHAERTGDTAIVTLEPDANITLQGPLDGWPAVLADLGVTWPAPGQSPTRLMLANASSTSLRADLRPPHPLVLEGQVSARLVPGSGGAAAFDADIGGLQWAAAGKPLRVDGSATLSLDLDIPGETRLARAGVEVASRALVATGPVIVTLSQGTIEQLTSAGLSLGGGATTVRSGELEASMAGWRLRPAFAGPPAALVTSGEGGLDDLALPTLGVALAAADVGWKAIDLGTLSGTLSADTAGLSLQADDRTLSGFDLAAQGRLESSRSFTGESTLTLDRRVDWPMQVTADLVAGTVTAELAPITVPAADFDALAAPLAAPWPEGFAFTAGELRLDGRVAWDGALGGRVALAGSGIGARLAESTASGLDFDLDLDLADGITGDGHLTLAEAQLAAGLALGSLVADIAIDGPADFGLRDVGGGLLGGRLTSEEIRLRDGELVDTRVGLAGFDLADLLGFIDVRGLEGSGRIDATLPLRMTSDGTLTIADGRFAANAPGHIAYSSGSPATNIGLQALENFQYETFDGEVDYDSGGDYAIEVQLLGRNPDLYGGHPIRFNLNIGGQMPALFRSLFLTGSFEEAILEQLRSSQPAESDDSADIQ